MTNRNVLIIALLTGLVCTGIFIAVEVAGSPTNHIETIAQNTRPAVPTPTVLRVADESFPLSEQEVRALYRAMIDFQDFLGYVKIGAPIAVFLLFTLGAGLGSYFVIANVKDSESRLKAELTKYLDDKTAAAALNLAHAEAAYTLAKQDIEKSKAEIERASEIKWGEAIARVRYSLAFLAWSQGDFSRAIIFGNQALGNIERVLALVAESEKKKLQEFLCHVRSDIAYYSAESFALNHGADEGEKGLEQARILVQEWCIFGDAIPLTVIDNYLFAISRIEPLSEQDKQKWIELFKNQREPIREFLKKSLKDGEPRFNSYESWFLKIQPPSPKSLS